MSKVERWIDNSEDFFSKLGLNKSDKALDFGCGGGNYTIAAAKYLKDKGEVYALDKDKKALRRLRKRADSVHLHNIHVIKTEGEKKIPLRGQYFDSAFLFDVVHLNKNRESLYKELNRVLKEGGTLVLYPTHYDSDSLVDKILGPGIDEDLEQLKREVESQGFTLEEEFQTEVIHNDSLVQGEILIFKKELER